ncbi:MAG: dockerin type I repeat-containing protein [Ruminococcus sp.]|nr:dockerin type I repeat-containing protein [Ruminococcus sp.]
MKKLVSILLVVVMLISIISINAYALSPLPPEDYVKRYFKQLYSKIDTVENLSFTNGCRYLSTNFTTNIDYVLVEYNSKNAVQDDYFNRFGNNNEYYEYCETTNLLFESGLSIFAGRIYYDYHDDDFYSLEDIATTNPEIIDMIIDKQFTERVGYIGDVDKDGEISVIDATEIQRHIARLNVLSIEQIADVDRDGETTVFDATAIQMKLAKIEAE